MKLVTYQTDGPPQIGAILDEQVVDLAVPYQATTGNYFPDDMLVLLREGEVGLAKAQAAIEYAQANSKRGPHGVINGIRAKSLTVPYTIINKQISIYIIH